MNRKTKRWTHLGLYTLILISSACQNHEPQEAAVVEVGDKNPNVTGKSNMGGAPEELSMDQQIKDAIADLAGRTGVAVDAITVKEARAVQWSSGAMGCPKPGMNYTQALVPGIRLLLEAEGTIYYYHGGRQTSLFNCPAERAEAPAYGPGQEIM